MGDYLTALTAFLQSHPELTLLMVFLVSFGEALLLIGLFMPSTVVLAGAGTLIGMGQIAFLPVFLLTTLGAVFGDAFAFWLGCHYRERLRSIRPFRGYQSMLAMGETFFNKHGKKSIFIVRFIPGVKAVVPSIAGMVGMSAVQFSIINIASAFVWAAVHLLPAIALGRGIKVTQSTNPRLMVLLVTLAVLLFVASYITRIAYALLLPRAERLRFRTARLLSASRLPGMRHLARLLTNENGMLLPVFYLILALLTVWGLVLLAGHVLFDPSMLRSDEAISAFIQMLRTDMFTRIMVITTMLGDMAVLLPAAVLLIGLFVAYRHWNIAGSLALAFIGTSVFVPLTKSVLHRARPMSLYDGADSFSFPSGHSTFSTVIFGLLALSFAASVAPVWRRTIYLAAAAVIVTIGFSRVYLMAHWPSDVAAGFLFGAGLIFIVAVFLHNRKLRVPTSAFAAVLAVVFIGIYPAHTYFGYAGQAAQYRITPQISMMSHDAWIKGGWQTLPNARVLLGGDLGEPMLLQTDMPLPDLVARLQQHGWRQTGNSRIDAMIAAILPATGGLDNRPPFPLTNIGQKPLATLVKIDPDGQARTALRLWKTDVLLQNGSGTRPLLQLSAARDHLDPVFRQYSLIEEMDMTLIQTDAVRAEILAALPADLPTRINRFGTPLLVSEFAP